MKSSALLIDSGSFFEQNLGQRLRREGFQLFFAQRLNDAVRIIDQKNIDVALLDLSGLKMEGIRIVKAIKNSGNPVEIITVNSADQLSLSIEAMKLGAFDDFLIPIEINPLLDRIKAAADRKKSCD